MLRSPWIAPLIIALAGGVGYTFADREPRMLDAVTVTIRPTRDNGAAWDFGGGLPDPRVRIERQGHELASCEAKDALTVACDVGKRLEAGVRVVVVDIDSSDHDLIGDVALDEATPALQTSSRTHGGGGYRSMWIALAIGVPLAIAHALWRRPTRRRRHA